MRTTRREKSATSCDEKGSENNSMRKKQKLEFLSIIPRGKRASLRAIQYHSKSTNVYQNSLLKDRSYER